MMPEQGSFDYGIIDFSFVFEHFQDFITEQGFKTEWLGAMSHLKGSIACKTAIGCDNMEVRIKILKIAEGLDSDQSYYFLYMPIIHYNPDWYILSKFQN
ncbi:MAG: hypothetical protein ABIK15_14940 [Pseudomonadota bacterium]